MIQSQYPLIDLHRHLDGNIRLETIIDLGYLHHIPLPAWDIESLRPHVQITEPQPGVMEFINKFKWSMAVLADTDACRRVAYENVEDAFNEGISYIELRFSPAFMAETHALIPDAVVEAVVDGVQAGQSDFGVHVNLIGIISRTYGINAAYSELNSLVSQHSHICAIDLAGDEINFPAVLFSEHFKKAHDNGLHITVHAGESGGPESIWQALDKLKAERIGHAIRALEDPELMDHLAEHQIGVESCLTSNVQTSCVTDYASHPLKKFLTHGILATINTDDPGISGIDLNYELEVAAPKAGLSDQDIHQAQLNAINIAFLSDTERIALTNHRDSQAHHRLK